MIWYQYSQGSSAWVHLAALGVVSAVLLLDVALRTKGGRK